MPTYGLARLTSASAELLKRLITLGRAVTASTGRAPPSEIAATFALKPSAATGSKRIAPAKAG